MDWRQVRPPLDFVNGRQTVLFAGERSNAHCPIFMAAWDERQVTVLGAHGKAPAVQLLARNLDSLSLVHSPGRAARPQFHWIPPSWSCWLKGEQLEFVEVLNLAPLETDRFEVLVVVGRRKRTEGTVIDYGFVKMSGGLGSLAQEPHIELGCLPILEGVETVSFAIAASRLIAVSQAGKIYAVQRAASAAIANWTLVYDCGYSFTRGKAVVAAFEHGEALVVLPWNGEDAGSLAILIGLEGRVFRLAEGIPDMVVSASGSLFDGKAMVVFVCADGAVKGLTYQIDESNAPKLLSSLANRLWTEKVEQAFVFSRPELQLKQLVAVFCGGNISVVSIDAASLADINAASVGAVSLANNNVPSIDAVSLANNNVPSIDAASSATLSVPSIDAASSATLSVASADAVSLAKIICSLPAAPRYFAEVCDVLVTPALEVFVLCQNGAMHASLGLTAKMRWDLSQLSRPVEFEFSQWFNILAPFPVLETNEECGFAFGRHLFGKLQFFPPRSWMALGRLCELTAHEHNRQLCWLYLLKLVGSSEGKQRRLCEAYSLDRMDQLAVEAVVLMDRGRAEEAVLGRLHDAKALDRLPMELVRLLLRTLAERRAWDVIIRLGLMYEHRLCFVDDLRLAVTKAMLLSCSFTLRSLFIWIKQQASTSLEADLVCRHKALLVETTEMLVELYPGKVGQLAGIPFEGDLREFLVRFLARKLRDFHRADRTAWLIALLSAQKQPDLFIELYQASIAACLHWMDEDVQRALKLTYRIAFRLCNERAMEERLSAPFRSKSPFSLSPEIGMRTVEAKSPLQSASDFLSNSQEGLMVASPKRPTSPLTGPSSPILSPQSASSRRLRHYAPKTPTTLSKQIGHDSIRPFRPLLDDNPFRRDGGSPSRGILEAALMTIAGPGDKRSVAKKSLSREALEGNPVKRIRRSSRKK